MLCEGKKNQKPFFLEEWAKFVETMVDDKSLSIIPTEGSLPSQKLFEEIRAIALLVIKLNRIHITEKDDS